MAFYHMLLWLGTTLLTVASLNGYKVEKYNLLMPNVRPSKPDLYLCTPVKVNQTSSYYLTGFEPNASMETTHHILLYGCTKPGSTEPVWDCGEMSKGYKKEPSSNPCAEGSQIIYAWARDAPKLILPKDVGFEVGGDSSIKYLILQVHYAHVDKFKDGSTDSSGIILHYTQRPLSKLAGVILLGTGGIVPPNSVEYMETSCDIKENKTIHPFAFRTHTHSLGKIVSGYRVRADDDGTDDWTLLGKHDPMKPQMFYPVENAVTLQYNDKLAARCTMKSDRNSITYVGATSEDEMCNFYLMYWVEGAPPLQEKYCFSRGPPLYYWSTDPGLNNIPNTDASTL